MRRFKLAGCAAIFILAVVSSGRGDGTEPTVDNRASNLLISQLDDPDPVVRATATQRLIMLGDSARPALRQELATASPTAQPEIDQVLLHIQWTRAGDDDSVQQAFAGYSDLDPIARCERIDGWMRPSSASGSPLLRVLLDDPSPVVRWEAADALLFTVTDNTELAGKLSGLVDGSIHPDECYIPPSQNAPLLAIAGWACQSTSSRRTTELMNQAVRIEREQPSAFRGQMNFAYEWLISRATLARDSTRLIELLREQAARTPWSADRVPEPVTDLFAAHADSGPMPGFAQDLLAYREYLIHPEMVCTMARLAQKQHHAMLADALDDIALLMNGDSVESHYLTGLFLVAHHWDDMAERELKWASNLSGGKAVSAYLKANIYFRLSDVADDRDDDLASAHYLETGLNKTVDSNDLVQINGRGQQEESNPNDEWAKVDWHYLRVARDAGDLAGARLYLDKLMTLDQEHQILHRDPAMAADIVPALQETGRTDQADKIFDAAYKALEDKVTTAPEDPMAKNNLAWLCACSGKHLDEAAKLAEEAVTADPDEAASLDTQAEVFLKCGHPEKAVEIETRALAAKPDDVYMHKQIARFKKAALANPR